MALINVNASYAVCKSNVEREKSNGTWATNRVVVDASIKKALTDILKEAVSVSSEHTKYMTEQYKFAKKKVDESEALAKKHSKKMTAEVLNVIRQNMNFVVAVQSSTAKASTRVNDDLKQFLNRSDFMRWGDLFHAKPTFDMFDASQSKVSVAINEAEGMNQRVGEYAERIKTIHKFALAASQTTKDSDALTEEQKEVLSSIVKTVDAIKIELGKHRPALVKLFMTDNSSADLTLKYFAAIENNVAKFQKEFKALKGRSKTVTSAANAFLKEFSKFDSATKAVLASDTAKLKAGIKEIADLDKELDKYLETSKKKLSVMKAEINKKK
jgi:hypothetical protein